MNTLNPVIEGQLVTVDGATKRYGELAALDNFNLTLQPGTFTVLLGPSGSGKSTLIRSIAGIEKLDGGRISFGERTVADFGVHLPPEKRDLAMVFQDYALWPHMSAAENVGYALKRRNLDDLTFRNRVTSALERVGLANKLANYPHELSGGEQQRVALARAIVGRPSLLLFDEPLSNLDADLRERLRVEISTLTREIGATALYITHDQSEAFALADEIGVIRAGRLEQLGKPESVYQNPTSRFVAAFTGLAGSFLGTVKGQSGSLITVDLGSACIQSRASENLPTGALVDVLVRPAATSFARSSLGSISSTVLDVAFRGRGYEHVVECSFGILSGVFAEHVFSRGSRVELQIDPLKCIAFPFSATDE